jgi:hypothetical protein
VIGRRPSVPLPFLGKRDESGRRRCGLCGTTVPGRRVDWCSDDCVQRYLIAKGDQNAARRFLWKRDRGVCALCGTNTVTRPDEREQLRAWDEAASRGAEPAASAPHAWPLGSWDADHTVPIAEGGALARENLRTLCKPCHKRATTELRKRLSAKRAQEGACQSA